MSKDIKRTQAEWLARLTPEQYRVCREKGTERAFSGRYHALKTPGVYRCVGCGAALFDGAHKYDSGSGWPSFWQPLDGAPVANERDTSHGMIRVEVHCDRCGLTTARGRRACATASIRPRWSSNRPPARLARGTKPPRAARSRGRKSPDAIYPDRRKGGVSPAYGPTDRCWWTGFAAR